MTNQEHLSNTAASDIIARAGEDSLQEKVVDINTVFNSIGITWLNKDGSYISANYSRNKDGVSTNVEYRNHNREHSI